MKCWLITACAPFCGTEEYYGAYAEENPEQELINSSIYDEIIENLWVSYSYLLHIEDEEFDSEEEEQEAWDYARENWDGDCTVNIEEIEESELSEYFPEGCEPEIIYDERNNTSPGD